MATTGKNWLKQTFKSGFLKWPYNGLINVHTLMSGSCKYVMLHGKRYIIDVVRIVDPEMNRLAWLTRWIQSNHLSPWKQRNFSCWSHRDAPAEVSELLSGKYSGTIAGFERAVSTCKDWCEASRNDGQYPSWQLARKWGPQSYSCKEMDFASSNPNEHGLSLSIRTHSVYALMIALWHLEQKTQLS